MPSKSPIRAAFQRAGARAAASVGVNLKIDTGTKSGKEKNSAPPSPSSESMSESVSILRAVTLLKRYSSECEKNNGTTRITNDEVDELLKGFATIFSPSSSIYSKEVEKDLIRKFESHANVFDQSVQDYITQTFSNEGEMPVLARAFRRTSLVRRCIAAFGERSPPVLSPTTRVNANIDLVVNSMNLSGTNIAKLKELMNGLGAWDFSVFEVSRIAPNQTLALVSSSVLDKLDLLHHYEIDSTMLRNFLLSIQAEYLPNAYHNAEHAADVTHAIYYFLTTAGLGQHFPETCKLAAVLAAIIHDVSHPARTNAFLVTQDDPIAIRYSYRSPLEHMHCAVAFQVMLLPGNNIMQDMHKSEQSQIRQLMVDMVLATDNAVHSMYLGKLEGKLGSDESNGFGLRLSDYDDQRLILQIALHAADVSNPAKPFNIYAVWTSRILEEFYAQGDIEKESMMQVSIGFDRENPIPKNKMQAGFIIGIVRPVYLALDKIPNTKFDECLTNLNQNLGHWQENIVRASISTPDKHQEFVKAAMEEEDRIRIAQVRGVEVSVQDVSIDE